MRIVDVSWIVKRLLRSFDSHYFSYSQNRTRNSSNKLTLKINLIESSHQYFFWSGDWIETQEYTVWISITFLGFYFIITFWNCSRSSKISLLCNSFFSKWKKWVNIFIYVLHSVVIHRWNANTPGLQEEECKFQITTHYMTTLYYLKKNYIYICICSMILTMKAQSIYKLFVGPGKMVFG